MGSFLSVLPGFQTALQPAAPRRRGYQKRLLQALITTVLISGLPGHAPLPALAADNTSANTPATPTAAGLSPEQRQTLDRYFDALNQHHKLMGGVALSQGGQLIYERYLGQAGPAEAGATAPEIGPETQMRIGSISKSFTAVMIMQLIEAGRLSLETPLAQFFTDLPQAEAITISDLLNHRSGLVNFTSLSEYLRYMTRPQTPEAMLKRIASQPLAFAPGSQAQYSNSNYYLLSLILEQVLGMPYAQALSEKIVRPLGLTHTAYGLPANPAAGSARSFKRKDGQWVLERETDMSIPLGAGALVSTPREINHFYRSLFQGALLSPESLQQMMDWRDGYGRGLFVFPFGAQQGVGHNGGIDGFASVSVYFPGWDLNMTLLSNGQDLPLNDVALALMTVYAGEPFTPPDFAQQPLTLTQEQVQPLLGTYASAQIPLKIQLFWADDQLMAQATGQGAFPLTAYSETLFRFEQAGIEIVFDAPGEVFGLSAPGFVLHQSGQRFRFVLESAGQL